jgi:hypothetical protein
LSTTEGLHVPVIPLVDVPGNAGGVEPIQTDCEVPKLNAGGTIVFTVTVNVNGVTHCPADGVNVYTPLDWLLTADGFQVPVKLFVDVVGNVGTVPPVQIDKLAPKSNVGVIFEVTVTVKVVETAHCPAVGVNV